MVKDKKSEIDADRRRKVADRTRDQMAKMKDENLDPEERRE
jgi:hypothetical protein